jgi:hypothetical protein
MSIIMGQRTREELKEAEQAHSMFLCIGVRKILSVLFVPDGLKCLDCLRAETHPFRVEENAIPPQAGRDAPTGIFLSLFADEHRKLSWQ